MKKTLFAALLAVFAFATAFAAPRSSEYRLDISKFANIPLASDIDDGEYAAPERMKTGKFGGIDFTIPEPDADGNSVVSLSSLRDPKSREFSVDIPNIRTRFLYVLHSSGKNIRAKNKNRNIGSITVQYRDGYSATFWVKKDEEAISAFENKTGENGLAVRKANATRGTGSAHLSRFTVDQKAIVKITFKAARYSSWNIFGATLTRKDVPTTKFFEFAADEWKPIDVSDMEVKSGSALDVSAGMGHVPAGKFGRLRISKDGGFEFEGAPNVPVKFKGTNWRPGDWFFKRIKTKEDIDVLARAAFKQGYNLVRWRISMGGEREFTAPYVMKPEVLDMYDYFLYAMGREGVYTHLNLSSHDLGLPTFKWADRYDVKFRTVLGDETLRDAWRNLVKMQLNHVNPYTGKKWKDDPAIATTEYFNEMELGFFRYTSLRPESVAFGNKKIQAWLKNKYGTIDKLKEAWSAEKLPVKFDDFSEIDVFGDSKYKGSTDRSLFIRDCIRDYVSFCEKVVRGEEGFNVPLHQFNCGRRLDIEFASAESGSYMAQNVYFGHGTNFMAPDSRTPQGSSLDESVALGYFRGAAAKRMPDRPMVLSEWQHCHWNPYKHEGGVAFPALSALQGFSNLTIHDVAIEKKGEGVFGHAEVAKNPILRANEFLTYCFFYRGDVKKSPHRVDVVFDKKFVETSPMMCMGINAEQSKIAFLTGFAIDFPSARKISDLKNVRVKPADFTLSPLGFSAANMLSDFGSLGSGDRSGFDLPAFAADLKSRGILPKGNISDPANGVFQSDTGEIVLDFKRRLAKVITPKSEAVVFKPETKNEKLGALTVVSSDVAASVAAASMDGAKLADSSRIVLVYATDTVASGFKVSQSREALKFRGTQPILLRVGKLSAKLRLNPRSDGKKFALHALKLNGERIAEIPLKHDGGEMIIDIDTSKLSEPAVFYELVAE